MSQLNLLPEGEVTLYKQAGVIGRFQGSLVAHWVAGMRKYFKHTYGDIWMFFRPGEDTAWYFIEDPMHEIAQEFLSHAKDGFPRAFEEEWKKLKREVLESARSIFQLDLSPLSLEELHELYLGALEKHGEFWALGIFIDSFDAGDDQKEMVRITRELSLSPDEVEILVTPHTPSYVTAWEQALEAIREGDRTVEDVRDEFFWIRTDYHFFLEADIAFLESEAKNGHTSDWRSSEVEEKNILAVRGFSHNPFATFQTLTQWRDDRKRYNFTGLYGVMRLLTEVARRRGIDAMNVRSLFPDEAEALFTAESSAKFKNMLGERVAMHSFLHALPDGRYGHIDGIVADEMHAKLLKLEAHEKVSELRGMIACRGKASGVVRVVAGPDSESAKQFQKGDILITSMTRPEFVPLMRLSAAIVTDEGGITSHAAIVSRELKKPCVIGTKRATQVFVDGDMVEVDANIGIVRKL
jgi:phosphohistidine swiveling domain-containing protein